MPPQVLLLGGIASVQFGAAFANKLFAQAGPGGVVFMRLLLSAVILTVAVRPSLRGRTRADMLAALAFGIVLGLMNWSFYEALARLPIGVAVTLEFTGPLAVAVAGSRRWLDLIWVALAGGGVVLLALRGDNSGISALGVFFAFVLTSLAVSTRMGRDVLTMLTSMFNPLPSIALLPIALLWFGLGTGSLLFVLVHAVLWPLALSMYTGFAGVPATLKMAGRNYGLTGLRQIALILVPAALPSILSGLRVGWAFAWRTLIAAELVFGASAGQGGLGWYIFQNRNELYTDRVFAGLAAVIVIGLLVEHLVFDTLERVTVRRWGIQH